MRLRRRDHTRRLFSLPEAGALCPFLRESGRRAPRRQRRGGDRQAVLRGTGEPGTAADVFLRKTESPKAAGALGITSAAQNRGLQRIWESVYPKTRLAPLWAAWGSVMLTVLLYLLFVPFLIGFIMGRHPAR